MIEVFHTMLRPGQGFRQYAILRSESGETAGGRPCKSTPKEVGIVLGIMAAADPKEMTAWSQRGTPVSCKVVQYSPGIMARESDYLQVQLDGESRPRCYRVQGVENPGLFGHFAIYYCDEREDLNKCKAVSQSAAQQPPS